MRSNLVLKLLSTCAALLAGIAVCTSLWAISLSRSVQEQHNTFASEIREDVKTAQIASAWTVIATIGLGNSGKKTALEILHEAGEKLPDIYS